jgi:hypothetical protein
MKSHGPLAITRDSPNASWNVRLVLVPFGLYVPRERENGQVRAAIGHWNACLIVR